jgi:hypothetical protein
VTGVGSRIRFKMRTSMPGWAAAILLAVPAVAADAPASAAALLSDAQLKAADGNKRVFLIFHASW